MTDDVVPQDPKVIQVLMHEALRADFQAWLTARGLVLQRTPFLDDEPDMPVYNVAPGAALMHSAPIQQSGSGCGPHCGEDLPGVTIHCRSECCHERGGA